VSLEGTNDVAELVVTASLNEEVARLNEVAPQSPAADYPLGSKVSRIVIRCDTLGPSPGGGLGLQHIPTNLVRDCIE
jgi:hypothetical protein